MSDYYIGFTFTDYMWSEEGDVGEIIAKTDDGRWEVRWESPALDHTFETDASIARMVEGE